MIIAIAAATVAAFVISAIYYSLIPAAGPPRADGDAPGTPSPAQMALEVLRSSAIAVLVAGLVRVAGWKTLGEGALLGLALWTMPVVLLVGSVIHEGTSVRAAATHAGDWLIKLVAVGAIVGVLV